MRILFLLIAVFTISGCLAAIATMPNQIETQTSTFDGTKITTMEPGWVYSDESFMSMGAFQLGLRANTKVPESVVIKAVVVNDIISINSGNSLLFNIDGDIVALCSSNTFTDFETETVAGRTYSDSVREYPTDREFIKRLLSAKSVKAKLNTSKGFIEGDFTNDKPQAAIRGFRAFIAATPDA